MKALVTGITGQDGAYLARFLLSKGYEVCGLYRRASSPNTWRLSALDVLDRIHLVCGDMTDMASLTNAIINWQPDEVYNLAAQSFVGTSFEQPLQTIMVDGMGVVALLEAVRQINPKIKLYHASTSELYGNNRSVEQGLNEESVFAPASPYAAAKLLACHHIRIYREAYGLFAVNGILFNHESPLRGLEFVTRKITNGLARVKLGLQDHLYLGNLDARRDWGYAPEYVEGMWAMLQDDQPRDYVLATGEHHSVREFVARACAMLELDPEKVVRTDEKLLRPLDVNCLLGDCSLAREKLDWSATTSFDALVGIMQQADLDRWQQHLDGEVFPWDAMSDPNSAASRRHQTSQAEA